MTHEDAGHYRAKHPAGTAPDPEAALAILAARLAFWLAEDAAHGFAPVRAAWIARAAHLGQRVEARMPHGTLVGIFEDVDADGALLVRTAGGAVQRVVAGDVTLRKDVP